MRKNNFLAILFLGLFTSACAQGYGGGYGQRQVYQQPIYQQPQGCNNQIGTGTVLGAATGGALGGWGGSQIGKGNGKLAATAGGAVLGLLLGGAVGNNIDQTNCLSRQQYVQPQQYDTGYYNPRQQYYVQPSGIPGQTMCREIQEPVTINGQQQIMHGVACMDEGGRWRILQ